MSVAAQRTPHKRHWEPSSSDSPEHSYRERLVSGSAKRYRHAASGRSAAQQQQAQQPHAIIPNIVAVLHGLFPEMDDKVIGDVLDECGSNIDAAIKRLEQLRLSGNNAPEAAQDPTAAATEAAVADALAQSGTQVGVMPAAAPVGAPSSSLLKEAAQQAALPGGHQQPTPDPQQDGRPKSSEEWVEALVQQMAGASDIQDARARAAQVLHAFEQALLEGAGGQGKSGGAVQRQLQDLLKDNHILKRAVAIQNNRIQEAAAKEAQLQQLRELVSQYEQKIHSLELSNYSLAMHLRQATSTISSGSQRSPDVF